MSQPMPNTELVFRAPVGDEQSIYGFFAAHRSSAQVASDVSYVGEVGAAEGDFPRLSREDAAAAVIESYWDAIQAVEDRLIEQAELAGFDQFDAAWLWNLDTTFYDEITSRMAAASAA